MLNKILAKLQKPNKHPIIIDVPQDSSSKYDFDDVILKGSDMTEILKGKIVKLAIFENMCMLLEFTDGSVLMYFGTQVTYTGNMDHIVYDKISIAFTSNKKRIDLYFNYSKTISATCKNGVCRYYYANNERK
mgnify:CR=1 FL=1